MPDLVRLFSSVLLTFAAITLKAMAALRTSSGPSSATCGAPEPTATAAVAAVSSDRGRTTRRAMKAAPAQASMPATNAAMVISTGQTGVGRMRTPLIEVCESMGTMVWINSVFEPSARGLKGRNSSGILASG